jgi:small-conductance mechanosensitive channel
MDFSQQLNDFRDWAFHFEGATQKWMWSGIAVIVAYLTGVILSRILRFLARKIAGLGRKKDNKDEAKTADHFMIDVLVVLVRVAFILVALALAANLLFGYSLEQAQTVAIKALQGLAILVAVWFLGSWLGARIRAFGERVGRHASSGKTLFHFLSGFIRLGAFAIGLIAALQTFGFDTASLIAVVGAAGLAIALALQDTLKAVAAGVIIAIFRPYRIGDQVRIAGQDGTVADITPFTTVLNTVDNREITVTNDKAWGDVIVNSSARSLRRIDQLFSISYDDDIDQAIGIIRDVLKDDPRVRSDPPPWIKVESLAASSVDIRARAWCASSDWLDLRGDTLKRVKQAFDKAGITIPYPTQVAIAKGIGPAIPSASDSGTDSGTGRGSQ